HFMNTTTFAARDFRPRRGASNDVWAEKNRRPEGCVAFRFRLRCSSVTAPLRGMLPRRASPEPKIDATNVVVFMKRGTKPEQQSHRCVRPDPTSVLMTAIISMTDDVMARNGKPNGPPLSPNGRWLPVAFHQSDFALPEDRSTDERRVLDAAVAILAQGEDLLRALSAETYIMRVPLCFKGV